MPRNDVIGLFAVKMHGLDTLFYVRIKLNDLSCEIPPAPLLERGRPLWVAISSIPLLQRGMEGDFHARGRQDFSVMNVYEGIKFGCFILNR